MIKFFRKIRQNMLNEGKTGKYFKYAIGEIMLVVIGILIALSINTWNENRKIRQSEQEILQNLKSDLLINKDRLNGILKKRSKEFDSGIYVLKLFNTDVSNIPIQKLDSILLDIEMVWTFEASDGTIKSLISSGKIDHIQSEKLKSLLSSFEGDVINATQDVSSLQLLVNQRLWPAIDGKINSSNRIRQIELHKDIPMGSYTSDYTWFFKNREMEDVISNIVTWKKSILEDEEQLREKIDQMILLVENELEK
ncbi:DUF6090 family protein [Maribacter arcticus]|nr:DUF6090 family protein [Maribacter arcticus]